MDGLDAFDPVTERFRVYRASGDGLNQYQVIAEDSQGTLWLGTEFTGLQHLDPSTGRFTIYRNRPGTGGSLSNDHVNAICIDTSGIIWIGTQNGLNRFDPVRQTFSAYYRARRATWQSNHGYPRRRTWQSVAEHPQCPFPIRSSREDVRQLLCLRRHSERQHLRAARRLERFKG